MAELLVALVDTPRSGDPRTDCQRHGRGDAIEVQEDGAYWSPRERTHPGWLIVKVPGMTLTEAKALRAEEPVIGTKRRGPANRYRHKRLFYLDADALFGPHPGYRVAAVAVAALGLVRAAKLRKPPVPDPAVLGSQKPVYVLG